MRLLLQPEHEHLADRHFAGAAAALKLLRRVVRRLSLRHITIVDPVFQSDSGGMEYPTLFTGGTRWLSPRGTNDPEYVVLHEAGHQFWYGMVANNEFELAWLDEGINEYSDSRVQAEALQPNYLVQRFFGDFIPWQYRDIPLKRATDTNCMNTYRRAAAIAMRCRRRRTRCGRGTHQAQSYHKAALMLHTLERMHTWEVMQRCCRPSSRDGSSSIRSRMISSRCSTRSPARTTPGSSTRSIAAPTPSTTAIEQLGERADRRRAA